MMIPESAVRSMSTKVIKIEFTAGRKTHIYRLGLGPCGRVVRQLQLAVDRQGDYEVYQWVEGERDPLLVRYPKANVLRASDYPYSDEVCAVPLMEAL